MPKFVVSIELHDSSDVAKTDFKEHIRDAVGHWGGGGEPDGPFFPDNIKSVTVRPLVPDPPPPYSEKNEQT